MGLNKEKIIGKTANDISTIHISSDHKEIDKKLLKTGGVIKYNADITLVNKEVHEFDFIKTLYYRDGNSIEGILGIMVDITHIKKQEELIRQQENLIHEQEKNKLQKEIQYNKKELTDISFQLIQNNQIVSKFIQDIKKLSEYSNKEGVKLP